LIPAFAPRNRFAMTERPAHRQLCLLAQRWQNLAEQRRAHFSELYSSGRWRHYYTEDALLMRMREIAMLCERWAAVTDAAQAALAPRAEPATHRDAA
jgi:uncharacterized repeat protein (TIGR03809 family)